jgi:hypothetical protein
MRSDDYRSKEVWINVPRSSGVICVMVATMTSSVSPEGAPPQSNGVSRRNIAPLAIRRQVTIGTWPRLEWEPTRC